MNNQVERFIFKKHEPCVDTGIRTYVMHEVKLRTDAPENTLERSIHLGLVAGNAHFWTAESVHSNVRSLGVFRTRESAGDRLLALAQEQGRVQ